MGSSPETGMASFFSIASVFAWAAAAGSGALIWAEFPTFMGSSPETGDSFFLQHRFRFRLGCCRWIGSLDLGGIPDIHGLVAGHKRGCRLRGEGSAADGQCECGSRKSKDMLQGHGLVLQMWQSSLQRKRPTLTCVGRRGPAGNGRALTPTVYTTHPLSVQNRRLGIQIVAKWKSHGVTLRVDLRARLNFEPKDDHYEQ